MTGLSTAICQLHGSASTCTETCAETCAETCNRLVALRRRHIHAITLRSSDPSRWVEGADFFAASRCVIPGKQVPSPRSNCESGVDVDDMETIPRRYVAVHNDLYLRSRVAFAAPDVRDPSGTWESWSSSTSPCPPLHTSR